MTARPLHGSWTVIHRGHFGPLAITWTRFGLFQISWQIPTENDTLETLQTDVADQAQQLQRMLHQYAETGFANFDAIRIDSSGYSEFASAVLSACRAIPAGETATYGDLARQVGRPAAARAVGRVMASNRIPIVVPCHRVVGSGGSLTGYSAPGGVRLKERLLNLERERRDAALAAEVL